MGLSTFWQDALDEGIELLIMPGATLVSRGTADKFVEWASKQKNIIGFEGFLYDGRSITPIMDCIADLSNSQDQLKNAQEAVRILAGDSFKEAQFIEFVFGD